MSVADRARVDVAALVGHADILSHHLVRIKRNRLGSMEMLISLVFTANPEVVTSSEH